MHKHDFDFSGLRPVCRENFRSFLFVSFLYHDLGTLVRCVNNTRTKLASASRGSFTRDATCNSHSEYIFPPSIYFSLSSFPLSFVTFSFASSHFLAASPTHEFFLLARFHSFLLDARASLSSYSPTLYSAALHNFYRCRETGGTYTLPHALVDSSYTYWMYACLHVDALMWSVRGKWVRRRDKRGRRKEGRKGKASEAREIVLSIFTYFVIPLCATYAFIVGTNASYRIVKFIVR